MAKHAIFMRVSNSRGSDFDSLTVRCEWMTSLHCWQSTSSFFTCMVQWFSVDCSKQDSNQGQVQSSCVQGDCFRKFFSIDCTADLVFWIYLAKLGSLGLFAHRFSQLLLPWTHFLQSNCWQTEDTCILLLEIVMHILKSTTEVQILFSEQADETRMCWLKPIYVGVNHLPETLWYQM